MYCGRSPIKACPYVHLNLPEPPVLSLLACKRIGAGVSYLPSSNSPKVRTCQQQRRDAAGPGSLPASAAQSVTESPRHREGKGRLQVAPKRGLTYTPFPPFLPLDLNPAPSVLKTQAKPRSTHLRHPPPEHQPSEGGQDRLVKGLNWKEGQSFS